MNIFFDLDGTLIDSKPRLYKLFQELVPESQLTYDDYWNLKKSKKSHTDILESFRFKAEAVREFETRWMGLIETDEWLKLDKPFPGITDHLLQLKNSGCTMYVVTARQLRNVAENQIKAFGWANILEEVLVTERKHTKEDLIRPHIKPNVENWIVGDTGMDVLVGKNLGIKTVSVLSGFQGLDVLKTYNPDYILQDACSFNPSKNLEQFSFLK